LAQLPADPGTAKTPGEFIEALRQFRVWAGNPSFHDLAKRCGERGPVASTICRLLEHEQLPARFEVVDSVIAACGGTDEDRQRFATAWRRPTLPERKPGGTCLALRPADQFCMISESGARGADARGWIIAPSHPAPQGRAAPWPPLSPALCSAGPVPVGRAKGTGPRRI